MVWGISVRGRTDLVPPQGFLNSIAYRADIRKPVVLSYVTAVGQRFFLMHDNARPHVSQTEFFNLREYCSSSLACKISRSEFFF